MINIMTQGGTPYCITIVLRGSDSAADLICSPRQQKTRQFSDPSAEIPFASPGSCRNGEGTDLLCNLYHNFSYIILSLADMSMADWKFVVSAGIKGFLRTRTEERRKVGRYSPK